MDALASTGRQVKQVPTPAAVDALVQMNTAAVKLSTAYRAVRRSQLVRGP